MLCASQATECGGRSGAASTNVPTRPHVGDGGGGGQRGERGQQLQTVGHEQGGVTQLGHPESGGPPVAYILGRGDDSEAERVAGHGVLAS